MKNDLNDLKKLTYELMENESISSVQKNNPELIKKYMVNRTTKIKLLNSLVRKVALSHKTAPPINQYDYAETVIEEEPLSLLEKEIEMIKQALKEVMEREK